jgi:NAD(P)H-hydrate epimerase
MSRKEVRAVDRWAIEQIGIPGVVLMENAGRSCAVLAAEKLGGLAHPKVCIFCGTGNNGGDGYVIARHLLNRGVEVAVFLCGSREKVRGDAKVNSDALERLGHTVGQIDVGTADVAGKVAEAAGGANLVIDAVFGTGLQGPLRDDYRALIEAINALGVDILAVDIPSGLDCDTGEPLGAAIRAAYTVTFVAAKRGFADAADAARYIGELYVASIGVEPPAP